MILSARDFLFFLNIHLPFIVNKFLIKKIFYYYYFFNFTILYWFCHTSTCILHGCTRVPDFHISLWNTHKRTEASRARSWLLNRKYICAYVQACVTDSIVACVSILAVASRKFRNFPPLFLNLVSYILWILIKPTVVWRVGAFVVFNFFYI